MKTFVQTRFSGPPAPGTPALSSFKGGEEIVVQNCNLGVLDNK